MDYFVVDAFAEKVFEGNPAGVCIMEQWPADAIMQSIAAENNLSETAFAVPNGNNYDLRWFTPTSEIDLCGHATLATAFVLANYYNKAATHFRFATQSGLLTVEKLNDLYELDFPAFALEPVAVPEAAAAALEVPIIAAGLGPDLLLLLENEQAVLAAQPDQEKLAQLPGLGVVITAPSTNYDFVSRFFAPKLGIAEDPVTGRGHCALIPFWAQKLGKQQRSPASFHGAAARCTARTRLHASKLPAKPFCI